MPGLSIIGPGRLGGALALALERSGYSIETIVYRSFEPAREVASKLLAEPSLIAFDQLDSLSSPVILIASGDPEIERISARLADFLTRAQTVLHTSGSLSSDTLSALRHIGCAVGSMHPLVSISDPVMGSERFDGAYFCVEGDAAAIKVGTDLASALGAKPFTIESRFKPLYHAAAVTASGHLVALIDVSIEMLSNCGLSAVDAKEILMPLIDSTLENLKIQTPDEALTGTFARADSAAFERHLAAMLEVISPDAVEIYLALAERSLTLALRRGADKYNISDLMDRISIAKANIG